MSGRVDSAAPAPPNTRPVPGHPLLAAGDDGVIWVWKRNYRKWRPLTARDKDGRAQVTYRHPDGRRRYLTVPKLVLSAWGQPRPLGAQVVHFPDPDYMNNALSNIRWGPKNTHLVGRRPSKPAVPRRGSAHKLSRFDEAEIPTIRSLYRAGSSAEEIAERYGVGQMTILRILRGERYAHVPDPLGPVAIRFAAATAPDFAHFGRLTRAKVRAIRRLAARQPRPKNAELAERFGVSRGTISSVVNRRTWKEEV